LALGAIHREIGMMDDFLGLFTVIGYQRRADRCSDPVRMSSQPDLTLEARQKSTRNRQSGISVNIIAKQSKLVAAESGEEIAWPTDPAKALGDDSQDAICKRVAVEIVDALEIIEVHDEERMLGFSRMA
jgi:hypothetical protein